MNTDLSDVQKVCLDAFKVYKDICDNNGLRYFAIGGTCIGAIRHHGFIPWDDDIDVIMPYNDLVEFIKCFNSNPVEPYEVYTPFEHKHFTGAFIKLINKNTTFIEKENKEYADSYKGIGIDIMPVFGLPEGKKLQEQIAKKNSWYMRINVQTRSSFKVQTTIFNKVFWICAFPLRFVFNQNHWLNLMIQKFAHTPFDTSDKVLFAWRRMPTKRSTDTYKSLFNYSDFSDFDEIEFEDTSIKVPKGFDSYLKMDFGEYMKLPPVDKRVSIHDLEIIDVKTPYREYKEGKI